MLDVVRDPAFQMPFHSLPGGLEVIRMQDIRHGRQPDSKLFVAITEQLFEAGRVEDGVGLQIPIPDAVIGATKSELEALFTDSQRFFSCRGPRRFRIRRRPILTQATGHAAEVTNHATQFILRFDGPHIVAAPVVGENLIGHFAHPIHRPNDGQAKADSQIDGQCRRKQSDVDQTTALACRRVRARSHHIVERIHALGHQDERFQHGGVIESLYFIECGSVLIAAYHAPHGAFG